MLPPGLPFITRRLAVNLIPAIAVSLAARILRLLFDYDIPKLAVLLLEVLSVPIVYVLRVQLRRWRVRRAAAQLGAVLPPHWDGQRFGNVDLLNHFLERFQNGYLGETLSMLRCCGTP